MQTAPQSTDSEILEAIYENTRKTKNYMKWSLIITIAFVVIPLIAAMVLIPIALNSVASIYSGYSLESLTGGADAGAEGNQLQNLIDQYTQ